MGVLQAMWDFVSGRRHEREREQEDVDRALATVRAQTRQQVDDLDREINVLRTTEAQMMEYLHGTMAEASRAKGRPR